LTRAEKQNYLDCQQKKCRHLHRCRVYWGRRCREFGGKKIPRLRMRPHALDAVFSPAVSGVRTLKAAWQ